MLIWRADDRLKIDGWGEVSFPGSNFGAREEVQIIARTEALGGLERYAAASSIVTRNPSSLIRLEPLRLNRWIITGV